MPVARNMKELEKMVMEKMKKKLPSVTKDYCHKWCAEHTELAEIVSEDGFIQMVNDSLKISVHNGTFNAEFGVFQNQDINPEHVEQMNKLWEGFKEGYITHLKKNLFNQK